MPLKSCSSPSDKIFREKEEKGKVVHHSLLDKVKKLKNVWAHQQDER